MRDIVQVPPRKDCYIDFLIKSQDETLVINPRTIKVKSEMNKHFIYADDIIVGVFQDKAKAQKEIENIEALLSEEMRAYQITAV